MNKINLENRVAIVTGGAQGFGLAITKRFIESGARVLIWDKDTEYLNKVDLKNTQKIEVDVSSYKSVENAYAESLRYEDKIDILINNAALFDAAKTVDISRDSYEKLYAVNVAGTLFTLQAVAKQMIKQGNGGKIINMASQAGRRGEALVAVYCSTKAAVISLTQSFGLDLIKYNINVNAIAPGVVDGEHWKHVDSLFAKLENKKIGQKKAEVEANVPAGRFGVPEDLTGMAIFLASKDADYIVSQTYNVDGGQWMS